MEKKESFLEKSGRILLTVKRQREIRKAFIRAGYEDTPYEKIGMIFLSTFIVAIVWYIYLLLATTFLSMGMAPVIAISVLILVVFEVVMIIIAYLILKVFLSATAYERIRVIENKLPLFLREFATNLKAGREFVDALEDSRSPQLGPLDHDIEKIIIEIKSGIIIEKVFKEYANRYDSYAINETFEIILDAYMGGGATAEIIDRIAENLEVIHYLKKNAIASVANYIIFTSIVALIIAPLLFALSYNLLWLISTLFERLATTSGGNAIINIGDKLDVNFEQFKIFSRIGVGIITGSAATIITIIRKGNLKGSPVLIFLFIILGLVSYEIMFVLLNKMFQILFSI